VPGEGFHSYRFMGLAVGDTLGTVFLSLFTAYLTNTGFLWNFIIWFVAGEGLHYLFGTPTAFLKLMGISTNC
jgi:hypothetical protein